MAISRTAVMSMSVGMLQVACIDWDSLRGSPDTGGSDAANAGADAGASLAAMPLVHWKFAQLTEALVNDLAPLLPNVSLSLQRLGDNAPAIEGEILSLRGSLLQATPAAGEAIGSAVEDAGGGLTAELWFQTSTIPHQAFLMGFDGRGFSLTVRDAELLLEVVTTSNVITVAYPLPFPSRDQLHHLAFTYRPGLAALVTCYLDGKAVAVAVEENPVGLSKLDWPTAAGGQSETLRVGDGQLDDLRVSTAAIFGRELDGEEIRRLYDAGPFGH